MTDFTGSPDLSPEHDRSRARSHRGREPPTHQHTWGQWTVVGPWELLVSARKMRGQSVWRKTIPLDNWEIELESHQEGQEISDGDQGHVNGQDQRPSLREGSVQGTLSPLRPKGRRGLPLRAPRWMSRDPIVFGPDRIGIDYGR